jgi:hypothetical protein
MRPNSSLQSRRRGLNSVAGAIGYGFRRMSRSLVQRFVV